jgi:hypothetical protein
MLGEYCQQRMGCSSAGSSVCNKHGKFSLEAHEIVHESHCWVSFVSFRKCSLVCERYECILDRTNLTSNSSADKLHCVAHHLCGCSYLQSFAIWSFKSLLFLIYISLSNLFQKSVLFQHFLSSVTTTHHHQELGKRVGLTLPACSMGMIWAM